GRVDFRPGLGIAASAMGNPGPDQAFAEVAASRYAKPRVLEPRAAALFGPIAVVGQRLIDQRLGDLGPAAGLLLLDRDRDREMRHAVEAVRRSIERIDDPPRLVGIALDRAAFLEQHAPVGPRIAKLLDDG